MFICLIVSTLFLPQQAKVKENYEKLQVPSSCWSVAVAAGAVDSVDGLFVGVLTTVAREYRAERTFPPLLSLVLCRCCCCYCCGFSGGF